MALECAHCGTRSDDGTARCPKCLRSTHLVPVPVAAPRATPRTPVLVVAAAVSLAIAGGVFVLRTRTAARPLAIPASVAPAASDPFAIESPELRAMVERARAEREPVARARLVASEMHRLRAAAVVGDDEAIPPPRSPDLLWRVLPAPRDRVTELDLARLVTAILRAADPAAVASDAAAVALRTAPARSDEPADPSGVLGSYVVAIAGHAVEVTQGAVVGADTVRHQKLTPGQLAGAISSQAALELVGVPSARDRALQYASAAVDAWPDATAPLAARARVWMASGGFTLAENDLRAAVSMHDDAALHMLLSRLRLLRDDPAGAAFEALRASSMAPAWGTAAVALLALHRVTAALDAGAAAPCALLRSARVPWTDDAYALCSEGVAPDARAASARRLFEASRDPLRVAFAAASLPSAPDLLAKVPAPQRREAALWLTLLDRPELAAPLLGMSPDGGVR